MARERERDGRDPKRFESEIRDAEIARGLLQNNGRLYTCKRCGSAFEEKSRFCPNCSRKNCTNEMGYLTQIPPEWQDYAQRRALARARAKALGR